MLLANDQTKAALLRYSFSPVWCFAGFSELDANCIKLAFACINNVGARDMAVAPLSRLIITSIGLLLGNQVWFLKSQAVLSWLCNLLVTCVIEHLWGSVSRTHKKKRNYHSGNFYAWSVFKHKMADVHHPSVVHCYCEITPQVPPSLSVCRKSLRSLKSTAVNWEGGIIEWGNTHSIIPGTKKKKESSERVDAWHLRVGNMSNNFLSLFRWLHDT